MKVAISKVKPSPDNAAGRSKMTPEMKELIATIEAVGVCESIGVRPDGKGYEVIGGERRLFAAKKAGLKEIDVVVHDVDKAQARLMRLASLTNEDWGYEEFAERIWRELEEREINQSELGRLIGLKRNRIDGAVNFHSAKMADAVVVIDGKIRADATATIWRLLKNVEIVGADHLKKLVAAKVSEEWKPEAGVKTRNFAIKLCNRIKKAAPNIVVFGKPDDKDYEKHNFEVEAILRIEWGIENYETEIKYIAEGMEEAERKRWEAARFDENAMKKFADALIAWKKALKVVEKTKVKFSPDAAQFCANLLEEVRDVEDQILGYFNEKLKEL